MYKVRSLAHHWSHDVVETFGSRSLPRPAAETLNTVLYGAQSRRRRRRRRRRWTFPR